jgi:hypothetical protein
VKEIFSWFTLKNSCIMKKSLLFLSFLFFTSFITMAQGVNSSVEKRVSLLTRVMASELGLNEAEYLKLLALNRERVVKSDEIAELYAHDQGLQTKKLLELEASFDKKFKTMLSPTQLAAYKAYSLSPATDIALSEPGNSGVKKE